MANSSKTEHASVGPAWATHSGCSGSALGITRVAHRTELVNTHSKIEGGSTTFRNRVKAGGEARSQLHTQIRARLETAGTVWHSHSLHVRRVRLSCVWAATQSRDVTPMWATEPRSMLYDAGRAVESSRRWLARHGTRRCGYPGTPRAARVAFTVPFCAAELGRSNGFSNIYSGSLRCSAQHRLRSGALGVPSRAARSESSVV